MFKNNFQKQKRPWTATAKTKFSKFVVRWLLSSKLHTHRTPLSATKSSARFCCYHMEPLNLGDSNDGNAITTAATATVTTATASAS